MVAAPKGYAIKLHAETYSGEFSHDQFAGFQFLPCTNCEGFVALLPDFLPFHWGIDLLLSGEKQPLICFWYSRANSFFRIGKFLLCLVFLKSVEVQGHMVRVDGFPG